MDKTKFIESFRSAFAKEGYNEEQLKGIEKLAEANFETIRTANEEMRTAVEAKMAESIRSIVGEMGNDETIAATISKLQESVRSLKIAPNKPVTFWDSLRTAFEENKQAIENTKNGGSIKLSLRDAGIITLSNIVMPKALGSQDTAVDAAQKLPEVLPSAFVNEIQGGVGSNPYKWMERNAGEGAAAYVTEGDEKPYLDFDWEEAEVTAKLISAIVPISNVATWNYPTLETEVRDELMDELLDKYNNAIINGSGTTEINGILPSYATEFVTAGLAVENANLWDALILAWKQSRKAVRGQRPDAIFMSIDKIVELDLQKDKNGQYLLPTWITNGSKAMKGIPIVECEYLTEKQVLIGNFSKVNFNFVKNVEIEVGWINDDFRRNRYALRGEFYGMQFVKKHRNNFVKITDVDAAVDAITINPAG
jgi:HK97 family phage major capsid protein